MPVVGLDIGTSTIKICLLDRNSKLIFSEKRKHVEGTHNSAVPGRQNGVKILTNVLSMLKEVESKFGQFTDICISGQMHGIVLWHDNLIWNNDLSCVSDLYNWMYHNSEGVINEIHNWPSVTQTVHNGFGSVTLVELMKKAETQGFNRCGTIMDLLACYLTKCHEVKMSEQLAGSWGLTENDNANLVWNSFFKSWTEKYGMILPDIVKTPAVIGKVKISDVFMDTNVYVPIGDLQASVYSIATDCKQTFQSNVAFLIIGTSAQLCTVQTDQVCASLNLDDCKTVQSLHFDQNYKLLAACSMNGGNVLESTVRLFTKWAQYLQKTTNQNETKEIKMNEIMQHVDVYSEIHEPQTEVKNICFIPERNLEQETCGLDISNVQFNTDLVDVLASVSEQIVRNMFRMFPNDLFKKLCIERVVLIGEANRTKYIREIKRNVGKFNGFVQHTESQMDASLGAILMSHINF